jgi:hypothetical protein
MNLFISKSIAMVLSLLLAMGFGIWLSRLGRPLNGIVFAFHKILSIAAIVLWVTNMIYLQKNVGLLTLEAWFLGMTALLFLFAIISGALLSFDRTSTSAVMISHRVSAILVFVSALVSFCLPANRLG